MKQTAERDGGDGDVDGGSCRRCRRRCGNFPSFPENRKGTIQTAMARTHTHTREYKQLSGHVQSI